MFDFGIGASELTIIAILVFELVLFFLGLM